jgi:predicted dehydrogenase
MSQELHSITEKSRLRLAVIGCGAIAETGHLPAALKVPEVQVTLLVDKDAARASDMARNFGVSATATTLDHIEAVADAAILCLPHHLHCPVALDLAKRGLHLLVEKPMALDTAECDKMILAAETSGVVLAVGLMRRYFRCTRYLKQILAAGVLGAVERFRIEDGGIYAWPSASPFILSRAHSGGGVLIGNGSHVMDSLIWWFGEPREVHCTTNAFGGMETDAYVEVVMQAGSRGVIELSRTRSLANRIQVWAERGSVDIALYGNDVSIGFAGCDLSLRGRAIPTSAFSPGEQDLTSVMADQLRAWVGAISGKPSTIVTGSESRRSIALIERCYQVAKPLSEAWVSPLEPL